MYDVLIVGAGINGGLLAYNLSKFKLNVAVVEKCNDVGNVQTAANSAIVHSGHDPKAGTLKASLNVRGNDLWEDLANELKIDFIRNGALVVATEEEQLPALEKLYNQTIERGIKSALIDYKEITSKEPNISDNVIKALELPTSAIISPWEATIAAIEAAVDNGVDLKLDTEVYAIENLHEYFIVKTTQGNFETKIIINSAGIHSDDIYRMVSNKVPYNITPRRGEYFVLDRAEKPIVTRTIYPLPSKKGKGVLVVPTVHNNILLGPNSEIIEDKNGIDNTAEALSYVKQETQRIVKNIPFHTVIRTFSGLRATHLEYDYVIEEAKGISNFINLIGIESPGISSAPAISEYVIENILSKKIELVKKESFKERRAWVLLNRMSETEKQEIFKKDSRFGQVICRCEQITEGEIVDVIHRNAGATTVKSIKRRLRPGAGRCQGGFCEPRVLAILARELKIDQTEVLLDSDDSKILLGRTKDEKEANV